MVQGSFEWILLQLWVQYARYKGDGIILFLYAGCFLYLFLINREFRKKIGWAMLLLIVLIFNPFLYMPVWHKLTGGICWRLYWFLCEAFICCYAAVDLMQRIPWRALKWVPAAGMLAIFILYGTNVYTGARFLPAQNAYKIPQEAVDVSEALLALDDHPKAVVARNLFNYIRQYSDDIELLYGRNIQGYTIREENEDFRTLYEQLKSVKRDAALIASICDKYDVEYVVHKKNLRLEKYGYEQVEVVDEYRIYQKKKE